MRQDVPPGGKFKSATMHRFNKEDLAVDYVNNTVGLYKQETLVQFMTKDVSEYIEGGYLLSIH